MKKSFQELIDTHETPVLVDFFAEWCGPCKVMSPVLEELAKEYQGKLKIVKVDVDKNPRLAEKYQIRGIPTMILFDKGKVNWKKSGAMPLPVLKKELSGFVG
ncbi:MAG: thioredoxin [Microscillaceae bacterium]|nr:thioredoxin [Microscillaceae bacterium]